MLRRADKDELPIAQLYGLHPPPPPPAATKGGLRPLFLFLPRLKLGICRQSSAIVCNRAQKQRHFVAAPHTDGHARAYFPTAYNSPIFFQFTTFHHAVM